MLKKIFFLCIVCLVGADEEGDTTVEFSAPESSKPIENPENATQLILQEIESHEAIEHLKMVASGGSQMSVSGFNMSNRNISENIDSKNASANASAEAKNKIKVECTPRVIPENEIPTVALTNSSMLLKALTPTTTNTTTGECIVVLFYSAQCVFSARMAPHYNALPRVFPDILFYAVDAMEQGNLHVRFGLVYVPNVMLFHNAKPIARFNETILNLENFVKFIHKFTGLEHNDTLNVTSVDMIGPVPSTLTKKVDYVLILAWIFTLSSICFGFIKSPFCQRLVEFLKNTWQEAAAAQHEHED